MQFPHAYTQGTIFETTWNTEDTRGSAWTCDVTVVLRAPSSHRKTLDKLGTLELRNCGTLDIRNWSLGLEIEHIV